MRGKIIIPAKTEIQFSPWIPAFAGMTNAARPPKVGRGDLSISLFLLKIMFSTIFLEEIFHSIQSTLLETGEARLPLNNSH